MMLVIMIRKNTHSKENYGNDNKNINIYDDNNSSKQ